MWLEIGTGWVWNSEDADASSVSQTLLRKKFSLESKKSFVTSDWHAGHEKSILFDHRPFRDLKHMHEVLINNYNSTVPKDGICYFLGDIGFKDAAKEVIPRLHGKKICVLGNHDKKSKMYEAGFDLVVNGIMLTLGKSIITMSHCPLRGVFREGPVNQDGIPMKNFKSFESWHGESRHDEYSFPDFGQTLHCHGHVHKRPGNDVKIYNQWDIGVVGNGYRPVSFSALEAHIAMRDRK